MLKSKLAAAIVVALAFGSASAYASNVQPGGPAKAAQDTSSSGQSVSGAPAQEAGAKPKKLETVSVTGSLIPQTVVETSKPVITITAQQLKDRGFSSVADALQAGTFATGSVQGPNNSGGFT